MAIRAKDGKPVVKSSAKKKVSKKAAAKAAAAAAKAAAASAKKAAEKKAAEKKAAAKKAAAKKAPSKARLFPAKKKLSTMPNTRNKLMKSALADLRKWAKERGVKVAADDPKIVIIEQLVPFL